MTAESILQQSLYWMRRRSSKRLLSMDVVRKLIALWHSAVVEMASVVTGKGVSSSFSFCALSPFVTRSVRLQVLPCTVSEMRRLTGRKSQINSYLSSMLIAQISCCRLVLSSTWRRVEVLSIELYLPPLLLHRWFPYQSIRWCYRPTSVVFVVDRAFYYLTCTFKSLPFKSSFSRLLQNQRLWMTLKCILFQNTCVFGAHNENLNEDRPILSAPI